MVNWGSADMATHSSIPWRRARHISPSTPAAIDAEPHEIVRVILLLMVTRQ